MANPTTNFGWVMPTSASLVTNLPADFNVFGQAVDTSMQYLLGGTTGQVLSKTSGTNMAFTWINNDQGDITGVTAGTGISVASPTGPVPTVSIDTAVTADLTTSQTLTNKKLSDSTTTIVDATDATKAIKFDVAGTTGITGTIATAFTTGKTVTIPDTTGTVALTNGVVNNTLTTTTGDIIYASAANTPARLGIGSASQVLSVSGGIPAWSTPSSGALTLISTTSFTSQSSQAFNSVFSSTYRNYKIIMSVLGSSDPYTLNFYYRASGTNNTSANYNWGQSNATRGGTLQIGSYGSDVANMPLGPSTAPTGSTVYFNVDATVFQPFGLGKRQTIHLSYSNSTNGGQGWSSIQGYENTAYDGFAITPSAGTITGTVSVYGMSN